jgi:hypothetical protein
VVTAAQPPGTGQRPGRTVRDAVQAVISLAAPGELAYFDDTSTAFFEDPAGALHGRSGSDEPLGFGIAEAECLVSAIALSVVSGLVSDGIKEAVSRASQRGWQRLRARRRRRIDGETVLAAALPPVPEESAREAERLARRLAITVSIDPADADGISIAIYQTLRGGSGGGHGRP